MNFVVKLSIFKWIAWTIFQTLSMTSSFSLEFLPECHTRKVNPQTANPQQRKMTAKIRSTVDNAGSIVLQILSVFCELDWRLIPNGVPLQRSPKKKYSEDEMKNSRTLVAKPQYPRSGIMKRFFYFFVFHIYSKKGFFASSSRRFCVKWLPCEDVQSFSLNSSMNTR